MKCVMKITMGKMCYVTGVRLEIWPDNFPSTSCMPKDEKLYHEYHRLHIVNAVVYKHRCEVREICADIFFSINVTHLQCHTRALLYKQSFIKACNMKTRKINTVELI